MKSVSIPESIKILGFALFLGCSSLNSIQLPYGLTEIGDAAFWECKQLKNIQLPDSLSKIGEKAFVSCTKLQTIRLPDNVTEIGNYTFSKCSSLMSIFMPNCLQQIGDEAFSGCKSLSSISLPDGLQMIGDNAFSGCTSLNKVSIPERTNAIAKNAFSRCKSLTEILVIKGSHAEKWAEKNKIRFISKETEQYPTETLNKPKKEFVPKNLLSTDGLAGSSEVKTPTGVITSQQYSDISEKLNVIVNTSIEKYTDNNSDLQESTLDMIKTFFDVPIELTETAKKLHLFNTDDIQNGKRVVVDNQWSIIVPKGFIYSKDRKKIGNHLFVAMYPDPSINANKIESYHWGAIYFEVSQLVCPISANLYTEATSDFLLEQISQNGILNLPKKAGEINTLIENEDLSIKYVMAEDVGIQAYASIATPQKCYIACISFTFWPEEHDWNYCRNMLVKWLETISVVLPTK